jgi:molybdenum cofactor cytidylyltransferase
MSASDRPAVVVVAAGRGSRFAAPAGAAAMGSADHKLLQALGATTVLGATLTQVLQSRLPLVVVTTAPLVAAAAEHVAQRDIVVLGAAEAVRGMGSTIAAGIGARSDARGWLVLPADMPLVKSSTLQAVAAALDEHPIAYAQHAGRRGHPVGFGSELYSELVRLDGDEGARRLLARYPAHAVDVDDPGVLVDIDTPQDLERARTRLAAGAASAAS